MSGDARFCSKCGAGLVEGAQFCAKCGAQAAIMPVAAAPVPPQPAAPAPPPAAPAPVAYAAPAAGAPAAVPGPGGAERVLAIIPNTTLKAGLMGVKSKQYTLILTDRRVIFAQITMAMMKQLVADARDDAKSGGKGFFGQWGAQLSAYAAFAERYLEMPPDAALAESANNFAIDRSTISKTAMKTGHIYGDDTVATDRVVIKTTGKKYDITLGSSAGQAKEALIAAQMI